MYHQALDRAFSKPALIIYEALSQHIRDHFKNPVGPVQPPGR